METLIKELNQYLSDLAVFYRKLQNYHWNVKGSDFFVVHEKLEEYYDEIREQIDEVAEHILSLGYQPLGTMQDFINNSEIQEARNEKIKTLEIVKSVIHDIQILNTKATKIKEESEKQANYVTSSIMDNYLENYAKKMWMLNETLK